MHIEPGIVTGAKMALSYATAAGVFGYAALQAVKTMRRDGVLSFAGRTVITTALALGFFEVLPHYPVGVSEVHFILGSTLFLLFGLAPAAFGLAGGLLLQGLFFAPTDLPQYFINATTLLAPLFAMSWLARRIIPEGVPYVELRYRDVLPLSLTYQAGIVSWVAFWAFYGQGVGVATLSSVGLFGINYMVVVLIEPLADLAVLAAAKLLHRWRDSGLLERRLFGAAGA